jgi:4-hydroxy-3-polyprenylbenzoate decarboxylase
MPRLGEGPISEWLNRNSRPRYADLREFLSYLERSNDLLRIDAPIDRKLEITEFCRRSLVQGGPSFLFENVIDSDMPVLGNLFTRPSRVAEALGMENLQDLREAGELLRFFKTPSIPSDLGEGLRSLPQFARLNHLRARYLDRPPCQQVVLRGDDVDLARLPIATCWPEDAGPLLTFGLVITQGPRKPRINAAIYRQQLLGRNKLVMRWLPHRGGAIDYQEWRIRHPGKAFPVSVVIGPDPATLVAAVAPIPDTLSEYQFAGLLRGSSTQLARCLSNELSVPATAEIVLEGHIQPGEKSMEGPFCDHTGYYNAVDEFPVFTVDTMTMRENAIYHNTYMGKPPQDEPSMLSAALNELYVPLLQDQFPEIEDFYLPPAACSYRIAVVSIRKQYAGHARRIMFGVWSYLRQFTYTKFVIVTDDDIDIRNMDDVMWAVSTRADPGRDTTVIENTPIDYLDFASPQSGLGGKLGIDATSKLPSETRRDWGRVAVMSPEVNARVDALWKELGLAKKFPAD